MKYTSRTIARNDINKKNQRSTVSNIDLSKQAQLENDSMVYLDGPQVYTCGQCRTHLTSHDDIISKSFHGRHGRAYLFDQCVNISCGEPEDRILITGLHSVSDIFCKRCRTLIGWTYAKAYEQSQKYKEGKYIIEKIHLHLEESDGYEVERPAGERGDKWRVRSMSWGSEQSKSRIRAASWGDCRSHSIGIDTSSISCDSENSPGSCVRSGSGSFEGSPSLRTTNIIPTSTQNFQHRSTNIANRYISGSHSHTSHLEPISSPRSPSDIIYEY